MAGLKALAARISLIALIAYLVLSYGFLITQAHGQDMFPAVKDGDLCIVYRLGIMKLTGERLSKQDVISYRVDGKRYFGRVIAVSGDLVIYNGNGGFTVNGSAQAGEILFPTFPENGDTDPFRVPDNTVYVLGDYRTQTHDSRTFGPIPLSSVEGKLITILRRRGL